MKYSYETGKKRFERRLEYKNVPPSEVAITDSHAGDPARADSLYAYEGDKVTRMVTSFSDKAWAERKLPD